MTTTNLGRIGCVSQGEWVSGTTYQNLDVVRKNGSVYACKTANTASDPEVDTANWDLWVTKGDQGIQGPTGPNAATRTIVQKSAAYTVVSADSQKIINYNSGTYTVSISAVATLGAGFFFSVWNSGTGAITVDPAGSETIDGKTTLILRCGEGATIVSDGTSWYLESQKPMRSYAENYVDTVDTRPIASGTNSAAIGVGSMATGNYSYAFGRNTTASGGYSICIGNTVTASGQNSVCISGGFGYATGERSIALGVATAAQYGKFAFGSASFSQAGKIVLSGETTGSAVVLTSDGTGTASAINQLIVGTNKAMAIQGTLIGKQQSTGNIVAYNITGAVVNNGGTMSVTGLALTQIGADTIGLTAAPTITVDNTNKGVSITSGYKTGTNIRFVAELNTSEVTY